MIAHVLDTQQLGRPRIIAVTAVEANDGPILFDTGPESTFDNVALELRKVGFALDDVRHVFLSHIHFDHAGAVFVCHVGLGALVFRQHAAHARRR